MAPVIDPLLPVNATTLNRFVVRLTLVVCVDDGMKHIQNNPVRGRLICYSEVYGFWCIESCHIMPSPRLISLGLSLTTLLRFGKLHTDPSYSIIRGIRKYEDCTVWNLRMVTGQTRCEIFGSVVSSFENVRAHLSESDGIHGSCSGWNRRIQHKWSHKVEPSGHIVVQLVYSAVASCDVLLGCQSKQWRRRVSMTSQVSVSTNRILNIAMVRIDWRTCEEAIRSPEILRICDYENRGARSVCRRSTLITESIRNLLG